MQVAGESVDDFFPPALMSLVIEDLAANLPVKLDEFCIGG